MPRLNLTASVAVYIGPDTENLKKEERLWVVEKQGQQYLCERLWGSHMSPRPTPIVWVSVDLLRPH